MFDNACHIIVGMYLHTGLIVFNGFKLPKMCLEVSSARNCMSVKVPACKVPDSPSSIAYELAYFYKKGGLEMNVFQPASQTRDFKSFVKEEIMKRMVITLAVSIVCLLGALYSGESVHAANFEPPPLVEIHNGQGGGTSCPSEFNRTPNGHVYADCECWDIMEGGSRCYGCSTEELTWELCTDVMSEKTSGLNRAGSGTSGLLR